jgi:hypothetical protein
MILSVLRKYVVSERVAIVNDTFHGKDVQLDGYSVMLTIKHLKESDFNVSYRLQLSYGEYLHDDLTFFPCVPWYLRKFISLVLPTRALNRQIHWE